jgi:hypothetical protein
MTETIDAPQEPGKGKLCSELAVAASAMVDTAYGSLPLKLALRSTDVQLNHPANDRLDVLASQLTPTLMADSGFPGATTHYLTINTFSVVSVAFYPHNAAHLLIRRVVDGDSPEGAIVWLQKVLSATHALGEPSKHFGAFP